MAVAAPSPIDSRRAVPPARVAELDGLRGIAVLMVIAFHWLVRLPPFSLLETSAPHRWAMADSLWAGVDLFFVISGFLIGGILLDHRDSPSLRRTFYIRRACRILPLYLLLVAVDFSPFVADWPNMGEQRIPWWAYLAFAQNFWTASGVDPREWLSPLWSVAIEEQFYLLAPLLVPLVSRRTLLRVLAGCIVAAPALRMLSIGGVLPVSHWDFTLCRLDAPAWGVLGALLVRHRGGLTVQAWMPRVRIALPVLLIAVAVTSQGILYDTAGRLAQFGIGLSLIGAAGLATLLVATGVPGSIAARLARLGPLVRIGRRSYALYLFHTPVMWFFLHQPLTPFGRVLFAGPVLLALVALSWRLIERPAISFGHRFAYAPRASSGQPEAVLPEIDRAVA